MCAYIFCGEGPAFSRFPALWGVEHGSNEPSIFSGFVHGVLSSSVLRPATGMFRAPTHITLMDKPKIAFCLVFRMRFFYFLPSAPAWIRKSGLVAGSHAGLGSASQGSACVAYRPPLAPGPQMCHE